jgi:mono/diheme cytochrome c family protein
MRQRRNPFPTIVATIAVLALIAAIAAALGLYDVSSDRPDNAAIAWLIQQVRERSIDVRSETVRIPALDNPDMIADGASDYDEMCTSCHLAPGMKENEMRPGLNPRPPVLALAPQDGASKAFWIIKHGIRMTGMPAWGVTHSDAEIWNIVAFLQVLPKLSPSDYRALVAKAAGHHEHEMGNDHMNMGH